VEVIPAALCADGGEVFDLQIAGFLKVMIIGNEVGTFLSSRRGGKADTERKKRQKYKKAQTRKERHTFSLQVICNSQLRLT
jgi:hypothetical protein